MPANIASFKALAFDGALTRCPAPLDKEVGWLYFTRRKTNHALPLRPDVAPMAITILTDPKGMSYRGRYHTSNRTAKRTCKSHSQ
jgi:hypothetical protein